MNNKDIAFWCMIAVVIALSFYVFIYIRSESYSCMTSPLTYGVSKLTSTDDKPISCSCSFPGTQYVLRFDKYNMTMSNTIDISYLSP